MAQREDAVDAPDRRRIAVLVAALVLAVVVAIGALSAGLPQPAPRALTDTPEPAADSGRYLDVDVAPSGTVWRTTLGSGCDSCAIVARLDPGTWRWERRGQVASSAHGVATLTMAGNGRDGFVTGQTLFLTHDGGLTWVESTVAEGAAYVFAELRGDDVFASVVGEGGGLTLSRTRIGSDEWRTVSLPPLPDSRLYDAPVLVRDRLAFFAESRSGESSVLVSPDGGDTWTREPTPCPGRVQPSPSWFFLACQEGGRVRILRSTDAVRWATWRVVTGRSLDPAVVPTSDESLLGRSDGRGVLVTVDQVTPVDIDPGTVTEAAFGLGGATYVVGQDDLLVSRDQGRTWQPLG